MYKIKDLSKTKEVIDELVRYYGGKIVQKKSSWLQKTIGKIINKISPITEDKYLNRYTTTFGRRIYIPFKVGANDPYFTPVSQLSIICHECGHIMQHTKDPWAFKFKYLGSSFHRAKYESECFSINIDLKYLLGLLKPSKATYKSFARKLENYSCSEEDIKLAEVMMEMYSTPCIETGESMHEPVRKLIDIMLKRGMIE